MCLEFVRCPFLSGRARVCLSVMWTRVVEESSVCECRVDETRGSPGQDDAEREPRPTRMDERHAKVEAARCTASRMNAPVRSGRDGITYLLCDAFR